MLDAIPSMSSVDCVRCRRLRHRARPCSITRFARSIDTRRFGARGEDGDGGWVSCARACVRQSSRRVRARVARRVVGILNGHGTLRGRRAAPRRGRARAAVDARTSCVRLRDAVVASGVLARLRSSTMARASDCRERQCATRRRRGATARDRMRARGDDDDDDDDALERVRRARDVVDETLDCLGVKRRPSNDDATTTTTTTRAMEVDANGVGDDALARRGKRSRKASEVMDAMSKLSLAFAAGRGGEREREREGAAPTTRASAVRRATIDLGLDDFKALDGANAMAEAAMEDAARGRDLELEVRRPRDATAWLLERALRGTFGGASSSVDRLTSLTLRGGKGLSAEGFGRLISALTDARSLKKLDLSACGLSASAGERIAAVLDENGCPLERLDLRGNALGAEGTLALASALRKTKTLKSLNLAQNLIGGDGLRALASALAGETSMEELDIQHNGCGDEGCMALATHGFGSRLETLLLGFNGIGAQGARAIAEALRKRRRSDDDDDMDTHELDDETNRALNRASKIMRRLDLKCNVVGSEGAHAMADALNDVEDLDLSNNSVRDGAKWLAKSLKSGASNLKQLNLQANEMTDDDAWYIADALGENKTLKTLNLGSNAFGDSAASDIASDLRENTALETLDLTRNGIGREGACELMDAMDENTTLTRLGLESNLIPAETTMEMKRRVGIRAQCDWQRAGFSDASAARAPMKFN